MNVLHVTRNIPVKNLEGNDIILKLLSNLKSRNLNQEIIFPSEYIPRLPFLPKRYRLFSELSGKEVVRGFNLEFYRFLRLPYKFPYALSMLGFERFLKRSKISLPDVVHAHYIVPDGLIALKLKKMKNIPYVITARQGDMDRINTIKNKPKELAVFRRVLNEAGAIITPNINLSKEIADVFNVKVETIPHGFDAEYSTDKNYKVDSSDIVKFVTCGQFIKRKNIDWVLDMLISLNRDGIVAELNVIGDGPLFEEFHRKYGHSQQIKFLGWVSKEKVIKSMRANDIFVLTSERETFGMVYLEAAINECLVVGMKNTGVDGLFVNNESAIFVDDKEELKKIAEFLVKNKSFIRSVARKGKESVIDKCSWANVTEQYLRIYSDVVGK